MREKPTEIADLLIFATVVAQRSFSAAATELGVSKSVVSKHVSALEASLGSKLLNRTTRSLTLTDSGRALYEHAARIAEEYEQSKAAVSRLSAEPAGTLRMTAPTSFATHHIAPFMPEFLRRYPKLAVELILDDNIVNLAAEALDLGVRIAQEAAPNLVARRLASIRRVIVASPAYLNRNRRPAHPRQLTEHNCLYYPLLTPEQRWHFRRAGKTESVAISGNLRVNSSEALHQAALAGLGIVSLPTFIVGDDIQSGRLRPLLGQWELNTSAVYAMYLPTRHLAPKVRVLIDFLLQKFGPTPYWDQPRRPKSV